MRENNEHNFYQRFKRHKEGYCSICNEFKLLTEDHIPPKACGNTNVKIGDYLYNVKKSARREGLYLKLFVRIAMLC